jgi:hypothetical protein
MVCTCCCFSSSERGCAIFTYKTPIKKQFGFLNHVSEPTPCPKDGQTSGTAEKADFELRKIQKQTHQKIAGNSDRAVCAEIRVFVFKVLHNPFGQFVFLVLLLSVNLVA